MFRLHVFAAVWLFALLFTSCSSSHELASDRRSKPAHRISFGPGGKIIRNDLPVDTIAFSTIELKEEMDVVSLASLPRLDEFTSTPKVSGTETNRIRMTQRTRVDFVQEESEVKDSLPVQSSDDSNLAAVGLFLLILLAFALIISGISAFGTAVGFATLGPAMGLIFGTLAAMVAVISSSLKAAKYGKTIFTVAIVLSAIAFLLGVVAIAVLL